MTPPFPPSSKRSPSPSSRPLATVRATSGAWERLRILQQNRRIAMVGLSADPMRPSHFAAIYMQSEGYDVIPVNPRYAGQTILGETVYSSLEEIPGPVDIVDVFRRAEELPNIARSAAASARMSSGCSWGSSTTKPRRSLARRGWRSSWIAASRSSTRDFSAGSIWSG